MMWQGLWLLPLALLHFVAFSNAVAVMSVDLGSEWIKVAIVSVCIHLYLLLRNSDVTVSTIATF